ncbi:PREDICTED: scaffold attachment factor B1-like isoform X2 [Nicrophorus vespilloides]|uniref:Scaffold attachment factor B1-like isoform X2 n=1 Tax=Nicrophorus vespilloides TaxID=110193 RepID=A0ABM1MP42_NICVS|nr:PREDICTED: scaffold attachment factor B1-like isoform X2 [Nicrophorus vespilloides]
MSEIDGKKLEDLRVVDLKQELENRGLDKTGNKQALIERLQKAILSERNRPAIMNIVEIIENSEDAPDEEDIKDIYDNDSSHDQTADSESPIIIIDDFDSKSKEESTEVKEDSTDKASSVESRDESVVDSKDGDDDKSGCGSQFQDKDEQQAGQDEDKMDNNEETEVVTEKSTNPNVNPNISTKDGKKADEEISSSKSPDSKEDADVKINEEKAPTPSKKLSNDQNRNLWITNISQNTRATELKQALSVHGRVMGAKVVMNARHPAACCYGYVKMETVADADNCITKLNNTELNGHIIRIEKVRPDYLNPLKNKLEGKGVTAKTTSAAPVKSEGKEKEEKKIETSNKDSKTEKVKEENHKDKEAKEPKDKEKTKDEIKDVKKADSSSSRRKTRSPADRRSRDKHRSTSRSRNERSQSSKSATRREREREVLTFEKIRDERDRERIRERERILRDRRREEVARQREIERNQRSEAARLEREREKLRRERERLERERAELMQFERERQKLEREKLELERMELERAKIRMQEEDRRAVKRPAPAAPYRERERSYEERKRIATDRHFDEAPPPPRDPNSPKKFAAGSSANKDYSKPRIGNYEKRNDGGYQPKREYEDRSHPASSSLARGPPVPKYDTGSYSNRDRNNGGDIRDPRMRDAGGIPSNVSNAKYAIDSKVSRYNERERDRSPHFRPSVRDDRDRRGITDSKPDMRNPRNDRRSYPDQQKDTMRYERPSASSASAWNTQKVFSATGAQANKQSWGKDTWRSENQTNSDRWNSASQARNSVNVSSSTFSGNNGMSIAGPSCPPPPGINTYVNERFDYKGTMGGGGGGANAGFYWKPPTP